MNKLGWHSLGTTFECECGETHGLPIRACHVGEDAAQRLAEYAREHCGKNALVVSDENTKDAAGEGLFKALRDAGKTITEKVYGRDPIDATEDLGEEVRKAGADADFFVSIGAGTLSDLAKYAGDKLSRPVLLYGTAASMNGYTSAIVALKVRGLKRTLPCKPAEGVFADPNVCMKAPRRMVAAGIGDFLSKCSSSTDWRAAHMLRGGYFCERPREFFEGTQTRLLEAAEAVAKNDVKAYTEVLKALMLSGLSMVVAGSSAPASGGEHLISHFLDMKSALYGTPHDLHGTQVGVATIYCLGLWQKVLEMEIGAVIIDDFVARQPPEEEIEAAIEEDWGPIADEIRRQWREKRLERGKLADELRRFKVCLDAMRTECRKDLLPPQVVARAIHAAGGPTEPEGLHAPIQEYRRAQRYARYIRNRFTVLDLAQELCLLH